MAKILTMPKPAGRLLLDPKGRLLEMSKPTPSPELPSFVIDWMDFPPYRQPDDIA